MSIARAWCDFKTYGESIGPGRGRPARPEQCLFCDGERVWFNGWRVVFITMLVNGQPHRPPPDGVPVHRVRIVDLVLPPPRGWSASRPRPHLYVSFRPVPVPDLAAGPELNGRFDGVVPRAQHRGTGACTPAIVRAVSGGGSASENGLYVTYDHVDGDGDLDLMLHFEVQAAGIDPGDTRACLTGLTFTRRAAVGVLSA